MTLTALKIYVVLSLGTCQVIGTKYVQDQLDSILAQLDTVVVDNQNLVQQNELLASQVQDLSAKVEELEGRVDQSSCKLQFLNLLCKRIYILSIYENCIVILLIYLLKSE